MAYKLSPEDRLIRRIKREFPKKKLLGDIAINDEEFDILIDILNHTFKYMYVNGQHCIDDVILCVALVQIGIRFYDGNYWSHVKDLIRLPEFNSNHQSWLGSSFIYTMEKNNKLELGKKERVNSILLHGFVSDYYSENFFNFLFDFYRIDLDRDIKRLDRNTMSDLIEIIKANDNTNRTYWLVDQTAKAVINNERGAKTRIRRFLKLIDKAFWDELEIKNTCNRLTQRFYTWTEKSKNYVKEKEAFSGIRKHGRKSFSQPYIKYRPGLECFELVIPPQMIRFESVNNLFWKITNSQEVREIDINPDYEGVTGYKTDEETLYITHEDLFSEFNIELYNSNSRIKSFRIIKEEIRFFDREGFLVKNNDLLPGEFTSFTMNEKGPESKAIVEECKLGNMIKTYFNFVEGDIIKLPDANVFSIANELDEGIIKRGKIDGIVYFNDDEAFPVFSVSPSLFAKIPPEKLNGSALIVNGTKFRLCDDGKLVDGVMSFDTKNYLHETGYIIDLENFQCIKSGKYNVSLDIAGDRSNKDWKFYIINGFSYCFEDAPYIFKTRGTLTFSDVYDFDYSDKNGIVYGENNVSYNFDIDADDDYLILDFKGDKIGFEVPTFKYRFDGETWQIEAPEQVWYADFNPKLQVKYPSNKIKFFLNDLYDEDDEEDHKDTFRKNKYNDLFECDLNRFKSWFGRESILKQIYMKFPEMDKPVKFMDVITKSHVVSSMLKGDFQKNRIIGQFDIAGKSLYFADLYFENELIAEKVPLTNGLLVVEAELKSGVYEAYIYEAEDDFGFGFGNSFYEIGNKKMELLNLEDLTGKEIEIVKIIKNIGNIRPLILNCIYKVEGLYRYGTSKNEYIGKMKVQSFNDVLLAYIPVKVEFFDFSNPRKTYITFLEDGENLEFLYDEYKHIIVKQEDEKLSKTQAYRRYKYSLYPEDFVFEINFVDVENDKIYSNGESDKVKNIVLNMKDENSSDDFEDSVSVKPVAKENITPQSNTLESEVKDESNLLSESGLPPMVYNCLKDSGIITIDDLEIFIKEKGLKGLYNINKLNGRLRDVIIDFIYDRKLI